MPQTGSTTLAEGQFDVPRGHLAVIVTHLVCHRPMSARAAPDGFELRHENSMDIETYRTLFRLVGRDWLWTSRLMLEDDALTAVLLDPAIALYTVTTERGIAGMVELDLNEGAVPRISFFGLSAEATGRGVGAWLMSHFQQLLFSNGAEAIRLDTCTLDSPYALRFYLSNGFEAERREVRVFPDPRALGLLDQDAAPLVPRL